MKKILTLFATALFASSAFSTSNLANITGYDLEASQINVHVGINQAYTGLISQQSSFLFNYTNGTGVLADGLILNDIGHLFFGENASITVFLDDYYYIDEIFLYSSLIKVNSLRAASINGVTLTSTPFGQLVNDRPEDDLFDLSGSTLENVAINQITLSNFDFISTIDPRIFTLSEIQVTGTLVSAVPEPSTYALMLGGLGLIGFMARRRRLA